MALMDSRTYAASRGSGFKSGASNTTPGSKPGPGRPFKKGDRDSHTEQQPKRAFSSPTDRIGSGAPVKRQGIFTAGGVPRGAEGAGGGPRSRPGVGSTALAPETTAEPTIEKPAKVKKPKEPKVPLDPNERISQRAYVGGLAREVTKADIEGRFKSFGELKDIHVAKDDVDGTCRGFAHITLDTTRKEWLKCVTLFNGAKWKGNVLKIQEANKDWHSREQESLEKHTLKEKKEQEVQIKNQRRSPCKHAEDMSLITEKNVDGRRGWKRGRYGRPVLSMRLEQNNVEKLFNTPGRVLPLRELIYQIDENEPIPKAKHLPTEIALAKYLKSTTLSTTPSISSTTAASTATPSKVPTQTAVSTKAVEDDIVAPAGNDRAMMASILAGLDIDSKEFSDIDEDGTGGRYGSDDGDDDDDDGEGYNEDLGLGMGSLNDTTADDMFGDLQMGGGANAPNPEADSGDEGEDENMESAEEYEGEGEEEEEDDDEEEDMDEETINAIAQLQQASAAKSSGGLFDSDDDNDDGTSHHDVREDEDEDSDKEDMDEAAKFAAESNSTRLKANEAREAQLDAARAKQQQLIASTLADMDSHVSKNKDSGKHVVFEDSDDYDSEDYEKMERDAMDKNKKMSIFDSDSGSEGDEDQGVNPKDAGKHGGVKDIFASDDEDDNGGNDEFGLGKHNNSALNIKEQFEGPGGKALLELQTKIGTSDSRFHLTTDFLDERIRKEDNLEYMAHQQKLESMSKPEEENGVVMDEDRQMEANIDAEKNQAMSVLRAMFGDDVGRSKKKEEDAARQMKGGLGFTTGLTVRYDPDAAPPPPPKPAPSSVRESAPETTTESKASKPQGARGVFDSDSEAETRNSDHDSESQRDPEDNLDDDSLEAPQEENNDQDEPKTKKKSVGFSFAFNDDDLNEDDDYLMGAQSGKAESEALPAAGFQVSSDLKSLFAPSTSAGSFKLFGGDDDEEEDLQDGGDVEDDLLMDGSGRGDHEQAPLMSFTQGAKTIFGAESDFQPLSHSGSLFFFHFNKPSLLKR
ncbi:hypothetical protein BGW38_001515 [Lunasporangiospora selenospora]|uniref:RRM domain-containing protein n=1 Tax=Lunasporangiospora selenospora TaxID=979761 RepID=A0A9P6FVG4_9FUNG|nr:hypothetical protein BGW38_001515 [Lunasporangiospora selenospora]